ncbi:hypothetical protein ABIB83_007500 [Bradyrhizobium sp. I1.8.5]
MQCQQCSRPAFWRVGESLESAMPLCLTCYATFQHVQTIEFLKNAAMLNNAAHQMDAVMPVGPMHQPIPVAEIARAMSKADTFNNIRISNSTVGAVNTGNLARINAAIEITKGQPTEEFGAKLKLLTEAIANSNEANVEIRQDLEALTRAIADQVLVERSSSKVVTSTLFERLVTLSAGTTKILAAAEQLHAAWHTLVG